MASRRSSRMQSRSVSRDEPVASTSQHQYAPPQPGDGELEGLPSEYQDAEGALLFDALSALNILKQGGSTAASPGFAPPPSTHQYHPHDPSRSASTASTHSELWGTSSFHDSSTGASSPVGTASHPAQSEHGDPIEQQLAVEDPNFISRVSQLPLVSGGLDLYQRSKNSSRVVKYGAGLVESSISAVGRPIANQLPIGQLDDFACRQLDRFGASSPTGSRYQQPQSDEEGSRANGKPRRNSDVSMSGVEDEAVENGGQVAVASRSRWQTVLMEAGGLGAAVSEESLKSLQYCLEWLLYASAHLDHQIGSLRDLITSLHRHGSTDRPTALVMVSASAHLTQIKHDVVETIRKVVDVVSKYAGAALPEQAKRYVRQSILGLPVKWASAIEGRNRRAESEVSGGASTPTGPGPSSGQQGYFAAGPTPEGQQDPALRPTEDAAERVLTFAEESLDMLRSVTGVFTESVEKAEAWIERLRVVGIDRQRQQYGASQATLMQDRRLSEAAARAHAASLKRRRSGAIDPSECDDFAQGSSSGLVANGDAGDEGSELRGRKRGSIS